MNGQHDDQDRVRAIETKIFAATEKEDFSDTMSALCNMIVFQMTLVCPECRKNIARKIRRDLPAWLNKANQLAATHPERQKHHHH